MKKITYIFAIFLGVWVFAHLHDPGWGVFGHGGGYYREEMSEYLVDIQQASDRIYRHVLSTFESIRAAEKGFSDKAKGPSPGRFEKL